MDPLLSWARRNQPKLIQLIREFVECESPSDSPEALRRFTRLLGKAAADIAVVRTAPNRALICKFKLPGARKQGQVLAELNAWDYRSALAGAEAKYQTALLHVNHSLAGNDTSEAGVERVQADYWKGEVDRARNLLDKTELRAPIDGVIATPHVENLVGRRLQYGDTFAEVMDTSRAIVDVAVDDADAGMLRAGQAAVIKLNSYAMRTFRGNVLVVSPKGETEHESRVFFARVLLPNSDGAIRSGMEGLGKVRVMPQSLPWYPAGYVIFRRPVIWIYSHLWSWFGW